MEALPTQLGADSGGIDGVAPVVSESIYDPGYQIGVWRVFGLLLIQLRADCLHHRSVGAFTMGLRSSFCRFDLGMLQARVHSRGPPHGASREC